MKIGEQLQKQRKLHKMSQDELADKLHISRQSISKWENGGSLPSFANVVAISDLFHISLDELILGDEGLMDKLGNSDRKISNTRLMVLIGIGLALVIGIILIPFSINSDTLMNRETILLLISFIIVLRNIKWKEFNKSLNRNAIIFGIVFVASWFLPGFSFLIKTIIETIMQAIK